MELHPWLNIIFLVPAAVLVIRILRSGGIPMLTVMGGTRSTGTGTGHAHTDHTHNDGVDPSTPERVRTDHAHGAN